MWAAIWGVLFGGVFRWLTIGLIVAVFAGSLFLWVKWEYVPRAEFEQMKQYTEELTKAYDKREKILRRYEEEKKVDDLVISEMEKDLEKLLREESAEDDDPIVLDSDDTRRLRDFLRGR